MHAYIRNIVIDCPDARALGEFYTQLLGMRIIRRDWLVIAKDERTFPRLAFEDESKEYRPPRWHDPEHLQQLHLELPVTDLEGAGTLALGLGATLLQDKGQYRTYADPAGHAFCLYHQVGEDASDGRPLSGRIGRIVYECFSPRALAAFYAALLEMPTRVEDAERRVVIAREDGTLTMLGFEHAPGVAPRWPDPAYPQQIHPDLHFDDSAAAQALAQRLGAIRLPAMGGSCPVYADPAAHPFCLCSPEQ